MIVTGCVDGTVPDKVSITLLDPAGDVISSEDVMPDPDGMFRQIFEDGRLADGTYSVTAEAAGFLAAKTVVVPEFEVALMVLAGGVIMIVWLSRIQHRMRVTPWSIR